MMLYRCESCNRKMFEKRAVCPECHGESFSEVEAGTPEPIVTSLLAVTPEGFEDSYLLVLARTGGTKVLIRARP